MTHTVAKRTIKGTPATPADYRKHPVIAKWSKDVVDRTKDGEAVFMSDLPLTKDGLALLYLEEEINTIPAGSDPDDVAVYWIKMPYRVGASDGVETKYILIKRDSGEVHARPVSPRELRQNFKVKQI